MVVLQNDLLCLLLMDGGVLGLFKRVLCVLLNEGDEALERPVTIVVEEITRTSGFELERRETRDAEGDAGRKVVLRGLHLCDRDTVLEGGEVLAQLVPSRLEALAVATP